MGSSSSGKHKHKKEKKHKRHRSRSPRSTENRSAAEEEGIDLTIDGEQHNYRRKHKKHKDRRESHHRTKPQVEYEENEVIALPETDSDSSDCVEVPLDDNVAARQSRSIEPPPPPHLSKSNGYDDESLKRKLSRSLKRSERDRSAEYEHTSKRRDYEYERSTKRDRERSSRHHGSRSEWEERERNRDDQFSEYEERSRKNREQYGRSRNEYAETDVRDKQNRSSDYEYMSKQHSKYHGEPREHSDRKRAEDRDLSPIPDNGAGDCLSIEETNKLRAKLGLKPLELESTSTRVNHATSVKTSAETRKHPAGEKENLNMYKDEWGEFLHKPADNLKAKADAEKLTDKLKQRKEKRLLEQRLAKTQTLGESDEELDDLSKWVERNKRVTKEKKEAAQRAKLLEELDAELCDEGVKKAQEAKAQHKAYTDKHLKGLKVDHDVNSFVEGKSIILTLKDSDVLDETTGDTLVNVNMLDEERYKRNVKNKNKNPLTYGYDVYEEQYDELGNAVERAILEKYDEDIDGKKLQNKAFVIGENIKEQQQHQRKLLEIKTKLSGKRLETLADIGISFASDTYSEAELAKFKKPKKKVKKLRQQLKVDDLLPLIDDNSTEQHLGSRKGDRNDSSNIEDDDDLERVLTKAMKIKQKENIIQKSLNTDVESIKEEIKTETQDGGGGNQVDGVEIGKDGHIVLNATAEFCRTLGDIPTYGMSGNRDEDSNNLIDYETIDTVDERVVGDQFGMEASHGTWNSVDPDEIMQPADLDNMSEVMEEVAILDEEPDVGAGVANALRLALSKGYLEKEEKNRPSNSKMAHLQAKNYSIEDKTTAEDDKFGRRDRFHSGPIVDFREKDNFKPNIKLEYIDDNGRILNLKEAFRYLSHKFHGKGPGKNKIEKRLKKMEQEGLMKTMSSTDTPLGTLNMLQQKQKETKAPYVVLSGGKQTSVASIAASTAISKFK